MKKTIRRLAQTQDGGETDYKLTLAGQQRLYNYAILF